MSDERSGELDGRVPGPAGLTPEVGPDGLTPEERAALDDVVDPSTLDVPADLDGIPRPPEATADGDAVEPGGDEVTGLPSADVDPRPDAEDLSSAIEYLARIATFERGGIDWSLAIMLAWCGALTLAFDAAAAWWRTDDAIRRLSPFARGVLVGAALVGVVVISGGEREPFVYFQF